MLKLVDKCMSNEKQSKYILGAQANVWTEYLKTSEEVECMIFPRMMALAEVIWTPPSLKNFLHFQSRLQSHY